MIRILFFIFLSTFIISTSAQSLESFSKNIGGSQFNLTFSNAEWRKDLGHPRIFSVEQGSETHFFSYGIALTGINITTDTKETGPYASVNNWINYLMLYNSKEAENYISLSSGSGLFVWIYSIGFVSHEKKYDTQCYFHLLLYAPKWPDKAGLELYYCEDYRSDGIAEVFSYSAKAEPEIIIENGKLFISTKLKYDSGFGGSEIPTTVEISGFVSIGAYK